MQFVNSMFSATTGVPESVFRLCNLLGVTFRHVHVVPVSDFVSASVKLWYLERTVVYQIQTGSSAIYHCAVQCKPEKERERGIAQTNGILHPLSPSKKKTNQILTGMVQGHDAPLYRQKQQEEEVLAARTKREKETLARRQAPGKGFFADNVGKVE
jgi:hypothetical protein